MYTLEDYIVLHLCEKGGLEWTHVVAQQQSWKIQRH